MSVTYTRIVCSVRPKKAEPNRVRITIGGNRINYPSNVSTPTADLLTVIFLINSVISTKGATFFALDISNFYLMTSLKRIEYMGMKLSDLHESVIDHYKLKDMVSPDRYMFMVVQKGIYGLSQ